VAAARAANLVASVDPVLSTTLRRQVAELRASVQGANEAAAVALNVGESVRRAPEAVTPGTADKAVREARNAATAAWRALAVAARVTDTVEAAAATRQATAGSR
jgi:hypothetical protein